MAVFVSVGGRIQWLRYSGYATPLPISVIGHGVGHINKVKLRRARLVLGLVAIFGWSTIFPLSLAVPAWGGAPSIILAMVSATAWEETASSS